VLIRAICGKKSIQKLRKMETYQFTNEKTLDQFNEMIAAKKRNGFVIIEHNEKLPYVVLSKEKKNINHSLHLFLTCITFGLWAIVWLYLIVTLSRKKNILVAVDEDGNLFEDKCLSQ
jgi:Txe/YoeB family toxin of Txe-Axe toxin-antitoxin module